MVERVLQTAALPGLQTRRRAGSGAANLTRYLGALAVLAVGVDHIVEYYHDYYRAIPTIGTLFLLDFIASVVVGLALLAPVRRLAGRHADRILTLLAAGGIAIGAGTLGGLLISENGGLFGFMEVGYRSALVVSMVFDVAAAALLGTFLVLRRRRMNFQLKEEISK